jgi:hypothetical protein
MAKTTEELLSEIRNDLTELRSRLDDRGPDGTSQEPEETIWKRLSARWDLLQGTLIVFTIVFTILTIIFTVIGVLSAVNLSDIQRTVRETQSAFNGVQDKTHEVETRAEKIIQIAESYPEMLGDVTQGDVLISEGNRQFETKDYLSAQKSADQAIAKLSAVLRRTGMPIDTLINSFIFRAGVCAADKSAATVAASCVPSPVLDQTNGTAMLRPAVCEALFAAEEFRIKAIFGGNRKEVVTLGRESAETLIVLYAGRPEGYHWMGLIEEEEGHNDDAAACFDASIHQTRSGFNRDYLNLAELKFVSKDKDFSGSYSYARDYLNFVSGSDPYASPAGIVAMFYLSLAEFMLKGDPQFTGDFRKKLSSLKGSAVLESLGRAFSPAALTHYLEDPDSALLTLTQDQQSEVRLTAKCLLDNKTCSE